MFKKLRRISSPATFAVFLCAATIATAGAAGIHRLLAAQGTGSNGSESAFNSSVSGSAFEGNVGTADTSYGTPFGLFGVYDNDTSQTFGIGVLGASTTGYGIAAEGFSNQPSILAYPGGTATASNRRPRRTPLAIRSTRKPRARATALRLSPTRTESALPSVRRAESV